MTRLQADLALALMGLIWGFSFVALKDAAVHLGPCTFVAIRSVLATLLIMPLAIRESRRAGKLRPAFTPGIQRRIAGLCGVLLLGSLLQQWGMISTQATNAAFLTDTYVVMVPLIGLFLYRQRIPLIVYPASALSLIGVLILSSGPASASLALTPGALAILLCAVCYALQVILLGQLGIHFQRPFLLTFLQFSVVSLGALVLAFIFETPRIVDMLACWQAIIYAGAISGGIGITVQTIAQQYTPPSDAAIIMSSEAVFGGIGGVWLLAEPLNARVVTGCGAIILALILVESGPLLAKSRRWRSRRASP